MGLDKPAAIAQLTNPGRHTKVAWEQTLPPRWAPADTVESLVPDLSEKPHVRLRVVNGEKLVLNKADLRRHLRDVIVLGTRPELNFGLCEVVVRGVNRLRLVRLLLEVGRVVGSRIVLCGAGTGTLMVRGLVIRVLTGRRRDALEGLGRLLLVTVR